MALSHPYAFHTLYNKAPTKRPCTKPRLPYRSNHSFRSSPHSTASEWRHPRGLTDAVRPATNHPKPQNQQKMHFIRKFLAKNLEEPKIFRNFAHRKQGRSPVGLERCSHIAEVPGSSPGVPTNKRRCVRDNFDTPFSLRPNDGHGPKQA